MKFTSFISYGYRKILVEFYNIVIYVFISHTYFKCVYLNNLNQTNEFPKRKKQIIIFICVS